MTPARKISGSLPAGWRNSIGDGSTEAEAIFAGLAERDRAARAYAVKCRSLIEQPPDAWNGVWVVTTK